MNSCSQAGCNNPVQSVKYQLCKIHSWERTHPGKNYFTEQRNKSQQYTLKMQEKQRSKPKKVYQFKVVSKPLKKKQTKIRQYSKKRQKLNTIYAVERLEYLKDHPICEVEGCNLPADQIHHKRGKEGYADKWAEENDIPLLIDKRWFMAVEFYHHRQIEDNPDWAKEKKYSLLRNENLDQ